MRILPLRRDALWDALDEPPLQRGAKAVRLAVECLLNLPDRQYKGYEANDFVTSILDVWAFPSGAVRSTTDGRRRRFSSLGFDAPSKSLIYERIHHLDDDFVKYRCIEFTSLVLQKLAERFPETRSRLTLTIDEAPKRVTARNPMSHPNSSYSPVGLRTRLSKKAIAAGKKATRAGLKNFNPFTDNDAFAVYRLGMHGAYDDMQRVTLMVFYEPEVGTGDAHALGLMAVGIDVLLEVDGVDVAVVLVDARWSDPASAEVLRARGHYVIRGEARGELKAPPTTRGAKQWAREKARRGLMTTNELAYSLFPHAEEQPDGSLLAFTTGRIALEDHGTSTIVFLFRPNKTWRKGEELTFPGNVTPFVLFTDYPATREGALRAIADYDKRFPIAEEGVKYHNQWDTGGRGMTFTTRWLSTGVAVMLEAIAFHDRIVDLETTGEAMFVKDYIMDMLDRVREDEYRYRGALRDADVRH